MVTWTVFGLESELLFTRSLFDFLILCLGAGTGALDLTSESVSELVSVWPGLLTLGSDV